MTQMELGFQLQALEITLDIHGWLVLAEAIPAGPCVTRSRAAAGCCREHPGKQS